MRIFRRSSMPIIFLLTFSPFLLFSQNNNQEINTRFENWNHFHSKKEYDRAIDEVEKAFDLAQNNTNQTLMAEALYRKGLSFILNPKRKKRNQKLAKEAFTESLRLATLKDNVPLRIKNLEELKSIAQLNNNSIDVQLFQNQIVEIQSLKQKEKEIKLTKKENESLAVNNEQLTQNFDQLAQQKEALSQKVVTLSDAQLKSELIIALQKNQVDSLGFKRLADSFLLASQTLMLSQQQANIGLQQKHIELQESQRNFFLSLAGLIAILAIGAVMRYWETKKYNVELETKNQIIEEERKRSDELLLNILPTSVAKELKENGVAKARHYHQATVLFVDFIGFSKIAEKLTPEELVELLDFYFKILDQIIGKYNIEKIKTIGDSYMCVSGLPEKNIAHAEDMVRAALEMQAIFEKHKKERIKNNKPYFEARIGIHTGPLVAGVVGSRKFAYDVWGDTVNVAARLESTSEAGKVNISSSTFDLIQKDYQCEYRGKIPIKNRGEVEMYFVDRMN